MAKEEQSTLCREGGSHLVWGKPVQERQMLMTSYRYMCIYMCARGICGGGRCVCPAQWIWDLYR